MAAEKHSNPVMVGLRRRMDRKGYWIAVACLLVLTAILVAAGGSVSSITFVPWMMIYAFRLHDFGRSGWWGVLALAVVNLLPLAGVLFGEQGLMIAGWAALLSQLGFTVWLGLAPGDPMPNRYPRLGKDKDLRGSPNPTVFS